MYWARCFIRFHGLRHPAEMGKAEVEGFLVHLALKVGGLGARSPLDVLAQQDGGPPGKGRGPAF